MLKLLIEQIPIIGQAYVFTKTPMKVYNSTLPTEAVKIATIGIIDDCAPPQIKYLIKCSILISQITIVVSSGSPWYVAMIIGSARQIIEK